MPYKDKAQLALNNKAYRERPEVKARRRAARVAERERLRERHANESEEEYRLRRERERLKEQAREARMTTEAVAAKRAYRRAWYRASSQEKLRRRRDLERARRVGATLDQVDQMRRDQGNKCALCRRDLPSGDERLKPHTNAEHIDHCHDTGRLRGILCGGCNTALGKLGDNFEGLDRARHYVSPPADPDCF